MTKIHPLNHGRFLVILFWPFGFLAPIDFEEKFEDTKGRN
jgi:hypothetical protein